MSWARCKARIVFLHSGCSDRMSIIVFEGVVGTGKNRRMEKSRMERKVDNLDIFLLLRSQEGLQDPKDQSDS